jgi:hypothetical protein
MVSTSYSSYSSSSTSSSSTPYSSSLSTLATFTLLLSTSCFVVVDGRRMNVPLIRSTEAAAAAAAKSERPGWKDYQRQPVPDFGLNWVVDKLKTGLHGVDEFFTEGLAAGKVNFKRLPFVSSPSSSEKPVSLSEHLRASRATSDIMQVGSVAAIKVLTKQNPLNYVYIFPRQILPGCFFNERNDHDRFRKRARKRGEAAANMLVRMETMTASRNPAEHDLYAPYSDKAAEILAAPSPAAALACLGREEAGGAAALAASSSSDEKAQTKHKKKQKKKNKKKKMPPLKGLPPVLVKGFVQATCDLPLGLANWAPAFFVRGLASGVLEELGRSDELLRRAQRRGERLAEELTRRDLLELAAARGFGHGGASDASLVADLEAWLDAVYAYDEQLHLPSPPSGSSEAKEEEDDEEGWDEPPMGTGWSKDPARRRAVLMGLNVLESVRRHPGAVQHRALFGGGAAQEGGAVINHPLADSYDAPLAALASSRSAAAASAPMASSLLAPSSFSTSTSSSSSSSLPSPVRLALISSMAFTGGFAVSQIPAGSRKLTSLVGSEKGNNPPTTTEADAAATTVDTTESATDAAA